MAFGPKSSTKPVEAVRTSVAGASVTSVVSGARAPETKAPPVEIKQVTSVKPGPSGAVRPSGVDEIRVRAFEIYQKRRVTGAPGGPESDWLQAERELRARV